MIGLTSHDPAQPHLLVGSEGTKSQVLLHTVGPEDDGSGEVLGLGHVGLDVGALHDSLLAVHALDEAVGEPGGSVGHGQGGTACSILGLDNLGTGILDTLSQGLQSCGVKLDSWGALAATKFGYKIEL